LTFYSAVNSINCGCYVFLFWQLRKLQILLKKLRVLDHPVHAYNVCVYAVCWWLFGKMYCKNKLISR